MLAAVTSFSPAMYESVAKRCVDSFLHFWPESVRLIPYWEGKGIGIEGFDLLLTEPCKSFLERHKDNPFVRGKEQYPGTHWSPKHKAQGYSYKFDAYKFGRKVFAVAHAARSLKKGKMFWLDADVVTHTKVTEYFLNDILPDDVALSYLHRSGHYSELGFVGYNLDHPDTLPFIDAYESLYEFDDFMHLEQWHDCWSFDHLVRSINPPVKHIAHTSRGQPFDHSVLASKMIHYKGRRKAA